MICGGNRGSYAGHRLVEDVTNFSEHTSCIIRVCVLPIRMAVGIVKRYN
jgi:hypothetical protein